MDILTIATIQSLEFGSKNVINLKKTQYYITNRSSYDRSKKTMSRGRKRINKWETLILKVNRGNERNTW